MVEPFSMQITENIKNLAKGYFDDNLIEEFISTFKSLKSGADVVGSFLQISTDEGEELEVGFFTASMIADITLSNGQVYSCAYPLSKVRSMNISDAGSKWVLTIYGEKKFDYNIVKPGSTDLLKAYEAKLRQKLFP